MSDALIMPNEPRRLTPEQLDRALEYCIGLETSDITLQTGAPIMAEIHGKLHPISRRELSNTEVGDILNAIYGPNGTAQILSGKDVDTHYEIRPSRSERYRFRVNGTGCQVQGHDGIQITLRVIPVEPPTLESLELPDDLFEALTPAEGVVYVTGATGSGKSTLLASIIRHIVESEQGNRKVVTYEAPIEFVFDSIKMPTSIVSQAEIPRHIPNFALGVRNALRRKPGLILVGEARDQDTIAAVIEAALTGHPVYTTLHSTGVPETVRRLVTAFPAGERHGRIVDILETIRAVVWQKLLPSTDGRRVALREYLIFDEQTRDDLLNSDPNKITSITRKLLKERGQTMDQDAEKKFKEGIIAEREYKLLKTSARLADRDA